ncbi:hypothetical protein [Rhodococcus sp. NCIMB 12038]|uniref:hypothetical protein n=1 Tax=Rhodococcus sp. NCIMB 12038 TaxID=933800 RepID=UPI00211B16E9|nr:hypothetical protein [Rhodococcus sp. NCIMB 12038]
MSAFLSEDRAKGQRSLSAAEQFTKTAWAETLADALVWLDLVLDVDLPDPPDFVTI